MGLTPRNNFATLVRTTKQHETRTLSESSVYVNLSSEFTNRNRGLPGRRFQTVPLYNYVMKISERLREIIEEQIATGELPPGSSLDEFSLARQHGVSRTPAREALIQLAAEGLIDLRPRRGAVVKSIGPTRLIEMFELMGELEAMCARLAARRINDADRARLLEAHHACEIARAESDSDGYFYCNERFHQAIYAASRNSYLNEQALHLAKRLRPYRRLQLRVRGRIATSYAEHEDVVNAILAGEADRAAASMREHVVVQGERFGDLLASLASDAPSPQPRAAVPAH
jgi:DNA-binding GntR family transcriptional regulator